MEKENRIPLPRRRPGSDGPAPRQLPRRRRTRPTMVPQLATPGSDRKRKDGPEAGRAAGQGGMGSGEARPGLAGAGASPGLPRRVRGMSDGPRPPAQVARPALPASFLERVRAAAEAEQRLEERAQEPAGQPAEPPAARPGPPRRPPRFVRSRDWMGRNTDKKDRARGDQPGPGPQGRTAGDQAGTAGPAMASTDLWTPRGGAEPDQARRPNGSGVVGRDGAGAGAAGTAEPASPAGAQPDSPAGGRPGSPAELPRRKPACAQPGPPAELPRRKPAASHRRDPAQAEPVAVVSALEHTAGELTEPIPVIRVSPTGEPLPPEGADQEIPAPDGRPVTAAVQAPDQAAAQAPVEQAPVEQASRRASPTGPGPTRPGPDGPECGPAGDATRKAIPRPGRPAGQGGPRPGRHAPAARWSGGSGAPGRRAARARAGPGGSSRRRDRGRRTASPAGRGPAGGRRGHRPESRGAAGPEVVARPDPPPGRPGRRGRPRPRRGGGRHRVPGLRWPSESPAPFGLRPHRLG